MRRRTPLIVVILLAFGLNLWGCSPYSQQVVPFKMPAAYPNMVKVAGLEIGAKAYPEPNEAQAVFGFDVRGAGLMPVQVVIDNKGNYPLEISPSQTFLVDLQNNFWPVLDKRLAYDRVARSAQPAAVGSSAAASGFLAGAAGALIGAAIGIVTGRHVGEAALKGAALGAAAGATVGGAQALGSHPVYRGNLRGFKDQVPGKPPHPAPGSGPWLHLFPGRSVFRERTAAAIQGNRQQPFLERGPAPL